MVLTFFQGHCLLSCLRVHLSIRLPPIHVCIQGVNMGIYNPTFPSIKAMTSSSTAQMSTTVVWIAIASGFGVLAFGGLFDQTSGVQLLSVCLVLQGLAVALAPTWPCLPVYHAMTALVSVFNFAIMSGTATRVANIAILNWRWYCRYLKYCEQ